MKVFIGTVVSKNMAKTATVAVEQVVAHKVYNKRFRRIKKYHVHDEMDTKIGDTVRFVACRPMSKLKKWKLVEIVGDKPKRKEKTATSKKNK